MPGLIGLDIDGTLTPHLDRIPNEVVDYLRLLHRKGWQIALLTGRIYSFAKPLLDQLDFPYLLGLQNGADIMSMPEKKLLRRCYLPSSVIPLLEKAYQGHKEDFIIYAGFEKGDFCYFRPERFTDAMLVYLYELKELSSAPWEALKEFSFSKEEGFPLIKCLGTEDSMQALQPALKNLKVASSVIRDPICQSLYLNLITDSRATKGESMRFLLKAYPADFVIAAGDDRNDLPMLECADQRIAMEGAPAELLKTATIIAKPAKQLGIINALEEAVRRARS